jgi:GDP-D-mannose dehydratase
LIEIIEKAFAYVGIQDWRSFVETESDLVRQGESKSIQIDPSFAAAAINWNVTTATDDWVGEMVQHHLNHLDNQPN